MSEHTKGPWIWNGGYLISYIPDKFSAGGYQDFEIIADDGSAHGEYSATLDPDSADARLIAAAPDLLEALEGVLSWHDDADNLHKPLEVRAAYMRARAAIARAKGGE